MPKTFTDDIAAAMPSSIDGPFQVLDPADSTNSIKLDPAGGQIEAGGSVRPLRRIAVSLTRAYASSSNGFLAVMSSRAVATGASGGFYAGQFRIPEDMDVSEPSNVMFLIATGATGSASAQVIRFMLTDTYMRGSGSSVTTTLTFDWTTPESWPLDDNRILQFDGGSGPTYSGDRFVSGDFVGMRISRLGIHSADTYSKTIHIAETIIFEYTANRF